MCKSTYLSLYIPSVLFGTKIPQYVLDAIKPSNAEKFLGMLGKAGLPHPHEQKFTKLEFLRFQSSLYDDVSDMWHTLYPNKGWMKERYACKNTFQTFLFIIPRALDLMGIRKKK